MANNLPYNERSRKSFHWSWLSFIAGWLSLVLVCAFTVLFFNMIQTNKKVANTVEAATTQMPEITASTTQTTIAPTATTDFYADYSKENAVIGGKTILLYNDPGAGCWLLDGQKIMDTYGYSWNSLENGGTLAFDWHPMDYKQAANCAGWGYIEIKQGESENQTFNFLGYKDEVGTWHLSDLFVASIPNNGFIHLTSAAHNPNGYSYRFIDTRNDSAFEMSYDGTIVSNPWTIKPNESELNRPDNQCSWANEITIAAIVAKTAPSDAVVSIENWSVFHPQSDYTEQSAGIYNDSVDCSQPAVRRAYILGPITGVDSNNNKVYSYTHTYTFITWKGNLYKAIESDNTAILYPLTFSDNIMTLYNYRGDLVRAKLFSDGNMSLVKTTITGKDANDIADKVDKLSRDLSLIDTYFK